MPFCSCYVLSLEDIWLDLARKYIIAGQGLVKNSGEYLALPTISAFISKMNT